MNFLDALDNHELALLQTLLNDKITALFDSGHNPPLFDLLVIADHHDVTAGLIELHRRLRYQKGCLRSAPIDNHVDDAAWDKQAFRIWQLCADQDRVRVGLDLNVEEIRAPGVRIHAAVGQLDVNSHMRVLVGRVLADCSSSIKSRVETQISALQLLDQKRRVCVMLIQSDIPLDICTLLDSSGRRLPMTAREAKSLRIAPLAT